MTVLACSFVAEGDNSKRALSAAEQKAVFLFKYGDLRPCR